MAKEEKGEKEEKETEKKQEKKEVKKPEKNNGKRNFFQIGSFLLLIVLIIVVLIVFQVPYTTTNAVIENVPVEKCTERDIPFVSNFRTGLTYGDGLKIYSSEGSALYKYSELKSYVYVNIRNTGDEKGIYCIDADAYLISDFTNDDNSLSSFQNLIALDSERIELLDNAGSRYAYPVCTENPLNPVETEIISLWAPSLISKDIKDNYNLDDVYLLFTIVAPTAEKCEMVDEEQTTEEEVTRYCNAWKHLVGRC